jgi:hypothetical protein
MKRSRPTSGRPRWTAVAAMIRSGMSGTAVHGGDIQHDLASVTGVKDLPGTRAEARTILDIPTPARACQSPRRPSDILPREAAPHLAPRLSDILSSRVQSTPQPTQRLPPCRSGGRELALDIGRDAHDQAGLVHGRELPRCGQRFLESHCSSRAHLLPRSVGPSRNPHHYCSTTAARPQASSCRQERPPPRTSLPLYFCPSASCTTFIHSGTSIACGHFSRHSPHSMHASARAFSSVQP